MEVTPFKFPPLFRKPKNDKISKRSGVRLVAVDCLNYFLLTLQDILNSDLSFIFGKMQAIKKYSRFYRFLLFPLDYSLQSSYIHIYCICYMLSAYFYIVHILLSDNTVLHFHKISHAGKLDFCFNFFFENVP